MRGGLETVAVGSPDQFGMAVQSGAFQSLGDIAWMSAMKCQLDLLAECLSQDPGLIANLECQQEQAPRDQDSVEPRIAPHLS